MVKYSKLRWKELELVQLLIIKVKKKRKEKLGKGPVPSEMAYSSTRNPSGTSFRFVQNLAFHLSILYNWLKNDRCFSHNWETLHKISFGQADLTGESNKHFFSVVYLPRSNTGDMIIKFFFFKNDISFLYDSVVKVVKSRPHVALYFLTFPRIDPLPTHAPLRSRERLAFIMITRIKSGSLVINLQGWNLSYNAPRESGAVFYVIFQIPLKTLVKSWQGLCCFRGFFPSVFKLLFDFLDKKLP